MGLFVRLDTNWPNNEKIIAVGLLGSGLHAHALCLAKSMETDGVIARVLLHRIGATDALIDTLIAERLFDPVDDRRVRVHGWLEHNTAASDYSEHGRRGNHKRYRHPDPFETCPKCSPSSGGDRGEQGDQTDTPSTGTPPKTDGNTLTPVDNWTEAETPSSLAIPRGGDKQRLGRRSPGDSPSLLESESESESETEKPLVTRAHLQRDRTAQAQQAITDALTQLRPPQRPQPAPHHTNPSDPHPEPPHA